MNEIDDLSKKMVLRAELGDCALNHENGGKEKAVDYIMQKFEGFDISIPVCQKCMDKLYDYNWKLWFCMNCMESKWIRIDDSKRRELYKTLDIMWIRNCPKCHKK